MAAEGSTICPMSTIVSFNVGLVIYDKVFCIISCVAENDLCDRICCGNMQQRDDELRGTNTTGVPCRTRPMKIIVSQSYSRPNFCGICVMVARR
jgi:hypothetical protein